MKSKFLKFLPIVLSAAICGGVFAACGGGNPEGPGGPGESGADTSTALAADNKIYLVGDSTVCDFGDTDKALYIPRYGYGTQIHNYFNATENQVKNLALSGRSSRSFLEEANYATLTSSIKSGDYLIIGFGHNDEKYEVDRYTDPTLSSSDTSKMIGTYQASKEVSFKYILTHYYIDVAISKGATPILCTPIVRLASDASKYDNDHKTSDKTAYTDSTSGVAVTTDWKGGDYAQAIRDLAAEKNITCVDLTTLTKNDYKTKGYDVAVKYHSIKAAKWTDDSKTAMEPDKSAADGTHTNLYGANMNAYYIADAVKNANVPLSAHVRTNVAKPVYEDYATDMVNSAYTIPEQGPFNPETDASAKWAHVTGTTKDATTQTDYKWYGTVFGANLGTTNIATNSNFTIEQGSDDNGLTFTVSAAAGKGKIQGGDDSLVAVFMQVPFETAFTVSATAKLSAFTNTNNQTGFGIMIRDDISIDSLSTAKSNYLNAGCIVTNSGANRNVYSVRKNGSLFHSGAQDFELNTDYALSVTRTSQSIAATVGSNPAYSAEKDFDLGASDSKYVYICLWATRGTTVTFSNISFATGVWEQA